MKSVWFTVIACMLVSTLTGCVERTITITSDPPGALVWLNDREIGRTPVDVDFVYYGTYDVRLEKQDHEPLMTKGEAKPPWWDNIPIDFAAEVVPIDLHADIRWHYTLEPTADDRPALIERADALRRRVQPEPATATETQPQVPAGSSGENTLNEPSDTNP